MALSGVSPWRGLQQEGLTLKRMKTRRVVLVVLTLVVGGLMSIFSLLENWKRDLTTNHARLDSTAADPLLRPLMLGAPVDEVADRIERWAATMPNWTFESREQTGDEWQVHLTHRTAVLRFVDDVHVRLTEEDGGTRVGAESRSRVGKGDLGQNPRNLRELSRGLQESP